MQTKKKKNLELISTEKLEKKWIIETTNNTTDWNKKRKLLTVRRKNNFSSIVITFVVAVSRTIRIKAVLTWTKIKQYANCHCYIHFNKLKTLENRKVVFNIMFIHLFIYFFHAFLIQADSISLEILERL